MGKTRDLFKKIRDTKGTFHANMGIIKDRNGMDLTEAEDTKNRWQEYTEDCTKKIFTTQIITNHKGNANQNHNEIPPHTHWDGYYKYKNPECSKCW